MVFEFVLNLNNKGKQLWLIYNN